MKTIPIALQTAKNAECTTLANLCKITCKDGTILGLTTLDEDIIYDDGTGAVTYSSLNTYNISRLESAQGTGVDNATATLAIAALEAKGITESQLRAGRLDNAAIWVYQVNYLDLTAGRHEIISRGNFGELSTEYPQASTEHRSISQKFKQGITKSISLTCRNAFGDTRCGKTFTWTAGTVTSVDSAEPQRVFTASALGGVVGFYVPGVLEWLTGANAGKPIEVEEFRVAVAGKVELLFNSPFPIVVADTFRIRQDCSKGWDDTTHGCKYHWPTDRALHFFGEPLTPIGREGELSTPGAEV